MPILVCVLLCMWWGECQDEDEGWCNGLEPIREVLEDYDIRAQDESCCGARERRFRLIWAAEYGGA